MELSSHHCDSVTSRTMDTVDLLSTPSVFRFAARCCICHAVTWSPNSSPSQGLQKPLLTRPCTDSLMVFPGHASIVNTRSVNFSKSRASLSFSDPTVPEGASWIQTSDGTGALVGTMSSTLMLAATEELTGTSVLELEPP